MIGHYTTGLAAGCPAGPGNLALALKPCWPAWWARADAVQATLFARCGRGAAMDLLLLVDPGLVGDLLCLVADLLPFPNVCV
jgi:hypothetical protein